MRAHIGGTYSRKEASHPETYIVRWRAPARASARFFVLVALGCAVLATAATACGGDEETAATPTAEVSATLLFQQLDDSINRGDVPASMALFSDDAVSDGGPACALTRCAGKAAIQADIEVYSHENVSFTACTTEISGNAVTARCEVRTNGTRRAGIERFIGSRTLEAEGGKISAFRWGALDISDHQTATYWADNGATLYQQYLDGINHGDIPAVMALFAEGAVSEGELGCSPAACTGKQAIRQEIERQVAGDVRLTSTKPQLFAPFGSVTTVTDVLEFSANQGTDQPASAPITLEMRGGKIATVRFAASVRD